jgi:hypothetical protein
MPDIRNMKGAGGDAVVEWHQVCRIAPLRRGALLDCGTVLKAQIQKGEQSENYMDGHLKDVAHGRETCSFARA